jgi:hypothetical protein
MQLGDKLPVMTHAFRTKAFDAALLDAVRRGAQQVVVLGAGFDSRGYRFQSQLRGVRFIEVDSGPTQAYKKERVKEILGAAPRNVTCAEPLIVLGVPALSKRALTVFHTDSAQKRAERPGKRASSSPAGALRSPPSG